MDAKRQKEKSRLIGIKNKNMKIWSASASKFYNEMMNGLASFFGLDANETTEAELHQQLTEAGSLSEIRATATKEANEAVAAQMADIQTQLAALTTKVGDLETDAEAKAAKVSELETDLETVRGQLAEKDTQLAEKDKQIATLSGEVATMKAGKPLDKAHAIDNSIPVRETKTGGNARVISMKELIGELN